MESSTNRRWVITGVLGLALLGAGCSAGADPLTQGGPAVVMDAGQSTTTVAAPPSDKLVGLSTTGGAGKGTTSARTPSAASPATAKKVPAASPRAVNSPDSPQSADSP